MEKGFYLHTKSGEIYFVTDVVLSENDQVWMVVYESVSTSCKFVRPLSQWNEIVIVDGNERRRFEKVRRFVSKHEELDFDWIEKKLLA
jgi:hypothetical protein